MSKRPDPAAALRAAREAALREARETAARERRRKAAERECGRPERLADMVQLNRFCVPPWFDYDKLNESRMSHMGSLRESLRRQIDDVTIVSADEVTNYIHETYKEDEVIDWKKDCPNPVPPFSQCFIEYQIPDYKETDMGRIGWMFTVRDREAVDFLRSRGVVKHLEEYDDEIRSRVVSGDYNRLVYALGCHQWKQDYVSCPLGLAVYLVDESGSMSCDMRFNCFGAGDDSDITQGCITMFGPSMLAISFMNCHGVTLDPVEPDPRVNRIRRQAGLRPFVRYHTIDIRPMKETLRTEGQVETEGLKVALHRCRGHFKTWTKDKPMFGRPGMDGTWWVPEHTKGDPKRGVVVSDYDVHAPQPDPEPNANGDPPQ